jgi:hypothetical protein
LNEDEKEFDDERDAETANGRLPEPGIHTTANSDEPGEETLADTEIPSRANPWCLGITLPA